MISIFNAQTKALKSAVKDALKNLSSIVHEINNESLAKNVDMVINQIDEPFMFVIVGEVKTGKSSFVNALLSTNSEICKVAPDPCTDTIQQILHGEVHREDIINPNLKKIYIPVDILKEICIVDTPGTNSISEYHQAITEDFIPSCDLVIFVFEAKNPYRESAWKFFDYIKNEWHKKIIFVVEQADLMETSDLAINIEGLTKYAIKKGIDAPTIFAVSAKKEMQQILESGYQPLRDYIGKNITGGKAPLLKLSSHLNTANTIVDKINHALHLRKIQHEKDILFRSDISKLLDEQRERTFQKINTLIESMADAYEKLTKAKEEEMSHGLNFIVLLKRSVLSVFTKNQSSENWLKNLSRDLQEELETSLQSKADLGIQDISESIHQMAQVIALKIQNSHITTTGMHEYFESIANKREETYEELKEKFSSFMRSTDSFLDKNVMPHSDKVSPNIATGSGIGIVGLIIAGVTKWSVMDITGGIISALGFAVAGITAGVKKNNIMKSYKSEVQKGKEKLITELRTKLNEYTNTISVRIDENFNEFDQMIDHETDQIKILSDKILTAADQIKTLEKGL